MMSAKNSSITKLSKVQLELCQFTFDYLLENGCWSNSRNLQVAFRKKGDLWEVASGIHWRLLRTGEKYQEDSEVKLSVEGISFCKGAEEILDLFVRVLKVFVDFYIRNPETPKVTFEELADFLRCDSQNCAIACILISEEPRLLSSHARLPDGKRTDFKLSPDILRYEQIEAIDDYLRILRDERKPMNELNADLQDVLLSFPSIPTGDFSQELLPAITDIVDNEKLREVILQDVGEIQLALSNKLWKSVCLLCGSSCEGLLLSALNYSEPEGKGRKKQTDYNLGLSKLIKEGIKVKILNPRVAKLADIIRDSRNLIHPYKALKDGVIDYSSAYASYLLLWKVCESIKSHIDQQNKS